MSSILDVLTGEATYHVEEADVLDTMEQIPDACIDFVFADVAYGLGNHEPTPEEILAFLQGERLNTGGDFMNTKWEIPSVKVWKEIFRVCKPGAHCFSYGGTRTFDLIAMGLRMAGFERRDTCMWVYGQGAAKGIGNVGKAIDKKVGAVRPVLGTRTLTGTAALSTAEKGGTYGVGVSSVGAKKEVAITGPATPEAEEWEGYGSGISPSWEPILICRKPLEGTLVKNVLKYGVGAYNIDACRIQGEWSESQLSGRSGHSAQPDAEKIAAPPGIGVNVNPKGRWPANWVASHLPGCVCVGTKEIETRPVSWEGQVSTTSSVARGTFASEQEKCIQHRGPNVHESVEDWQCVEGCPVAELDEQSGERTTSKPGTVVRKEPWTGYQGGDSVTGKPEVAYGDSGGASRYFPTFPYEEPDPVLTNFLYCAKSSRTEREVGCEKLPPYKRGDISGRADDAPGQNHPSAGVRRKGAIRNHGKCIKPIDLGTWLARLGGKPGGIALNPFAGTSSEMIACLRAGMRVIGIENDPTMIPIALARIEWWLAHPGGITDFAKVQHKIEKRGQMGLFEGKKP